MSVQEKNQQDFSTEEQNDVTRTLVLFNDDFNAFDYVIRSLVEVCEHDEMQAENCALIAHYKGKCPVKSGSFEELKPRKEELLRRKLTVEIQ